MSLEKGKMNFSHPIVSITVAKGVKSWNPWKQAWDHGFSLCVTPTPINLAASFALNLQVCPSIIFIAKDKIPSIFLYARRGLSLNVLSIVPKAKTIPPSVKYCTHNFFCFSFPFFSPQVLQRNSETNFCNGVNLPKGYFLPWKNTNSPKNRRAVFLQNYFIVIWDWWTVSLFCQKQKC